MGKEDGISVDSFLARGYPIGEVLGDSSGGRRIQYAQFCRCRANGTLEESDMSSGYILYVHGIRLHSARKSLEKC